MRSWFFGSVLLVVAASGATACTGPVEDAAVDPIAVPRADTGAPPASETPAEPASDPGDENEGSDPYFEAPAPDAGDAGVDAAPEPGATDDSSPPSVPAAQCLADEAARELKVMKVTAYEHTTFIDEATGTFKYDCSGFLGYALSRVLPTQFAAVKTFGAITRPLAKHYETFFESIAPGTKKSGWARVVRPIDLRPGDVVAWLKPADLVSTNTGHVMIVRGTPTLNPKRPDEVLIPITDSTSSFHGPTDSRSPTGEGLGVGPIGIIVDSKGAPIRYRWTGAYSTKEYSTAISFGRPE